MKVMFLIKFKNNKIAYYKKLIDKVIYKKRLFLTKMVL